MSSYKIVSGTPRCGSSINMRIHATKFDIAGKQFPHMPIDRDEDSEFLKYIKEKRKEKMDVSLNPNGFFEDGKYVMNGIYNSARCSPLPKKNSCIKIMGTGLTKTDPSLISSVLFSLRHPFEVAEAQTDLKNIDIQREDMWIRDLIGFIQFIEFSNTPYLISSYTDLCMNPEKTLSLYSDFYGQDFSSSISLIQGHKPRSTPNIKGQKWDRVLAAYHACLEGDLKGAKEALNIEVNTDRTFCPRVGSSITVSQCKMCENKNRNVIKTLKKRAEKKKVDWENEPCKVDCDIMTIKDSITNNHWISNKYL